MNIKNKKNIQNKYIKTTILYPFSIMEELILVIKISFLDIAYAN